MDFVGGCFGHCKLSTFAKTKPMKHVTIIFPDKLSNLTTISCVIGAFDIFTEANIYRKKTGKKKLYRFYRSIVLPA